MSPWARAGLTLLVVAVMAVVVFLLRWTMTEGLFARVAQVLPQCRTVPGLSAVQDIAFDTTAHTLFIAVEGAPGARDGIYALKPGATGVVRLAGQPPDFHPFAISLSRDPDAGLTLVSLDRHKAAAESVAVFSVATSGGVPALSQSSSITSGLMVTPSDLAAVGPSQFYVSNAHGTRSRFGRFAENDLLWPLANVGYFNGQDFRVTVVRIAMPSGIAASADGAHVFVAAGNERRLLAFSREPFTGNLKETGALSLPTKPSHVSRAPAGRLLVAGRPKPGWADVLRVHLGANSTPQSFDTLYAAPGADGARAAAMTGNQLYIALENGKLLDCTLK